MVFWNAPHPQPDHVERACRAALSAKAASERLNGDFDSEGLPPFVVRFGLHVGDAVVGNLGSAERMEYTALGSSVNLAARLEGLNKEYGTTILVSDAVRRRAEHRFHFRQIASVTAKGMTTETLVFELINEISAGSVPSRQHEATRTVGRAGPSHRMTRGFRQGRERHHAIRRS